MKKTLSAFVAAVGFAAGLGALQLPRLRSRLNVTNLDPQIIQAEEALQTSQLDLWQTLPVFGFENLVADWAFLNFLQYFGNAEARQASGYTVTPEFFQVIIKRDPYFPLAYRFLSSSVTLFAGQPEQTVSLLEEGLSHMTPNFPEDSYWLWRYKAVDELLFLGDIDAAIQSLETNNEWAIASPDPDSDGHAVGSRRTANFLRQNPDSRRVRANSWMMIWGNAINEDVRQYAQSQIEALGYEFIEDENGVRVQAPDAAETP